MSAIPFAGLAPDTRAVRGGGESRLRRPGGVRIGRAFGALGAAPCRRLEAAAVLVDGMNAFEHDGRPACALVRVFAASIRRLSAELAGICAPFKRKRSPLTRSPCVRLSATRGIEPAWNDVEQSSVTAPCPVDEPRAGARGARASPAGRRRASADRTDLRESGEPVWRPTRLSRPRTGRSVFGFGATVWPGKSCC